MSEPKAPAFKYYAFISYSRKDSKVAAWLQKRLEWFRFPVKLVPEDRRPPHGRYVRPIYRDKTNLEVTNEHYWTNIRLALEESRYLIVLCSEHSSASEPVNMEVVHFLGTHGGDASLIVPVIVSGNVAATGADAALCPALRDLGDTLTNRNLPTMVPDSVTSEPDAWEQGFVSLSSYLLHLERSTLGDHIQRETRRQKHVVQRWLAAVGMLGVLAIVAAWLAWWQRGIAEHRRGEAEQARTQESAARQQAEAARTAAVAARQQAETARTAAVEAARQTRLRASKADADIALDLASRGEDAHAFALAVRAIESNEENEIASVLAYRLLTDGRLALPEHLITHRSVATSLAFSNDGTRLAVGCDDGSLSVTDLSTGETSSLKKRLEGRVEKVAFSPDGASVVIAAGGQIVTWICRPPADVPPVVIGHFIYDAFSVEWPAADRIFVFTGRSWGSGYRLARILGPADIVGSAGRGWKPIFAISGGDAEDAAEFDDDMLRRVVHLHSFEIWVAGQSGLLAVQDYSKDKLLWLDIASPNINQPVFSASIPKGKTVFVAKDSGMTVFGYDAFSEEAGVAEHGAFEWVSPQTRRRRSVRPEKGSTIESISADGESLLLSTESGAALIDRSTGKAIGAPLRHDDDVFSPQFGPDGKWLVTASDDCTVRRWDAEMGAPIGEPLRLPSRVRYVHVSPGGDLIVTGRGDLIDVAKWSVIRQLTPHPKFQVARAFFSPDGLWLATVSDSFHKTGDSRPVDYTALDQWEISTGNRLAEPILTTRNTDFHWLHPGKTLVSSELTWQCVFPGAIRSVLPLLQACRPTVFDGAGERMVNSNCSLRSVRIEQLFPQGRPAGDAPEYDLAARVLRHSPSSASASATPK